MELSPCTNYQRWSVKAAWVNVMLEGRKQVIQENLHTFVAASVLG